MNIYNDLKKCSKSCTERQMLQSGCIKRSLPWYGHIMKANAYLTVSAQWTHKYLAIYGHKGTH